MAADEIGFATLGDHAAGDQFGDGIVRWTEGIWPAEIGVDQYEAAEGLSDRFCLVVVNAAYARQQGVEARIAGDCDLVAAFGAISVNVLGVALSRNEKHVGPAQRREPELPRAIVPPIGVNDAFLAEIDDAVACGMNLF